MNIFDSLKEEILRPIAVTIFPAVLAATPFLYFLSAKYSWVLVFYEKHEASTLTGLLVFMVGLGFVLEDLGTRIEAIVDWRLKQKVENFEETWDLYLKCRLAEPLPIAQSYIRRLLVRYKFEQAVLSGTAIGTLGVILCIWNATVVGAMPISVLFLYVLGIIWAFCEASSSGRLMHENRKRVLEAIE